MTYGQELLLECGCHIYVDHEQGDRAMRCDHGDTWVIRATPTTVTTYHVEYKANDG